MMIEIQTSITFTATSLPGFPARATRAEAEADEARGLEVQAFIDLLPTLTEAQCGAAWGLGRGEAWGAEWDTEWGAARGAAWGAVRGAGRGASRRAAWDAVWRAVRGEARGAMWDVAWDAMLAILARDLITAGQFAILTAPMRAAGIEFDKLGESK